MLAFAVFPALSMAVPLIVCKPAVVMEDGGGQIAMPERVSEQVKLTTALTALMIPFTGTGNTVAETAGGVRSIFSVVVAVAVWPEASVAVAEIN